MDGQVSFIIIAQQGNLDTHTFPIADVVEVRGAPGLGPIIRGSQQDGREPPLRAVIRAQDGAFAPVLELARIAGVEEQGRVGEFLRRDTAVIGGLDVGVRLQSDQCKSLNAERSMPRSPKTERSTRK